MGNTGNNSPYRNILSTSTTNFFSTLLNLFERPHQAICNCHVQIRQLTKDGESFKPCGPMPKMKVPMLLLTSGHRTLVGISLSSKISFKAPSPSWRNSNQHRALLKFFQFLSKIHRLLNHKSPSSQRSVSDSSKIP